jgi:ABC-type spermidine/putrescine transport system permease subunit I
VSKPPELRGHGEEAQVPVLRRYGVAFGRFWWDFLVGDTPELLIGAVVAVVIGALLAHHGVARAVTVVVLPALVIVLLAASVRRAQSRRPPRP